LPATGSCLEDGILERLGFYGPGGEGSIPMHQDPCDDGQVFDARYHPQPSMAAGADVDLDRDTCFGRCAQLFSTGRGVAHLPAPSPSIVTSPALR
jgi:hypothetical protein